MHAGAVFRGCIVAWAVGAGLLLLASLVNALWRGYHLITFDPLGAITGLLIAGVLPALTMTVVAFAGAGLAALLRATVTPPMAISVAFAAAAWLCHGMGLGPAWTFGGAGLAATCAGAGWLAAFGRRWHVQFGTVPAAR